MSLSFVRRIALAVAVAAPGVLGAQEAGIPVGNTAPDAALQTIDGQPAQLSQWIGKMPVVLEFWATWCSNCKALEPRMVSAAKTYGRQVKFPKPKRVTVKYGRPLLFQELRAEAKECSKDRLKQIYQQIAEEIMAAIGKLEPTRDE